jgi:hypothetical protein
MQKFHVQVLEPLKHLLGVLVCPFAWNCAFHDGESISLEVIAEVAKGLLLLCAAEEELSHDLVSAIGDGLCCAGHVVRCECGECVDRSRFVQVY